MEGSEYLHGGCFRDGTPSEKQGKGGDHFIVEDLLDFSNEEEDDLAGVYGGDVAGDNSTDSSTVTAVDSCSNSVSDPEPHFSGDLAGQTLADASLSGDLCEPYDELAELEWLSNFVEESFSSEDLEKLQLISGLKSTSATSSHTGGDVPAAGDRRISDEPSPQFRPEGPVPAKARSKRSRPAPCNWSSRLLVLSPSPASSSSDTDFIEPAICRKALKKKDPINATLAPADGRKCLHCATDKTPQWRTGPMGPKTLCNACGVRFKSGRLVPEYRPASSPTFMMSKHSNSHRKVLELRRQKEMMDQPHHHHHNQFLNSSMFDGPVQGPAGFEFLIHHHIGPDFRQLI